MSGAKEMFVILQVTSPRGKEQELCGGVALLALSKNLMVA